MNRFLLVLVICVLSTGIALAQTTPPPDIPYYSNLIPGTAYPIAIALPIIGHGTVIASVNGTALANGGTIFSSTGSWSLEAGNFMVGVNPPNGSGLHIWDATSNIQASPVLPLIAGKTFTVAATQNGYHLALYVCSPTCVKTFVPDAGKLGISTAAYIGGSGSGIRICKNCHIWGVRISSSLSDDEVQQYALSAISDPYPSPSPSPAPTPSTSSSPTSSPTASPTPTAVPTTVGGSCDTSALSNNSSWPASCQFALGSSWHQVITSNMASHLASNDSAAISKIMQYGDWRANYIINPISSALTNSPYNNGGGYPNYVCQRGDSSCVQLKVRCTGGSGYCSSSSGNLDGLSIYFPKYGVPEGGGGGIYDEHESVLDCVSIAPNCREVDMYDFDTIHNPPSGGWSGSITVGAGDYTDPINGSGWGDTSHGGTVTASGATMFPSLIRSSEIANGINGIKHAIQIDVFCGNGKVYPATSPLSFSCSNNTNAVPAGTRFYWDESCDTIGSHSIDAWSKAILCALHTYGGFATDTSDSTSIIFQDSEMQFGGQTGYANYLQSWAKTYGTDLGFRQGGGEVYSSNFNNGSNGFNRSFVSSHLHVLNPCVNGLAGTQGSC